MRLPVLLLLLVALAACSDGPTAPANPDGLVFEPLAEEFVRERPVLRVFNGTDRPLSFHPCVDAGLHRRDDSDWVEASAKPSNAICTADGPTVLDPGEETTVRPFYPVPDGDGTYRFILDAVWGDALRRIGSGPFRVVH